MHGHLSDSGHVLKASGGKPNRLKRAMRMPLKMLVITSRVKGIPFLVDLVGFWCFSKLLWRMN